MVYVATMALALAAAAGSASALTVEDWVGEVLAARTAKDSLLRHAEDTPLRATDISGFQGLRYFPIDERWRIEGELHRYGRLRRIDLPDTGGSTIQVERFGRFVFERDGKPFWLEVYRSVEGDGMTVYFTDETNGDQTYGAGRYAPVTRADDGTYVLDFNNAYNPYCAYNEDYVCPLPPAHNHLPFAVMAGELNVGPDLAHP